MFRNCLSAALRNLVRNKLYAAINVVGLAVGFAAALFAAVFVRGELTYDRWIPNHERIYGIATTYTLQRGAFGAQEHDGSHRDAAAWLKTDFPEVALAARYLDQNQTVLQHGDIRASETTVAAADPDLLSILRFPTIAGDLSHALDAPDSIALTRTLARKYFGQDAPLGAIIDVDQHPMRVTAVMENFPPDTTFTEQAFISSRASFSALGRLDAVPTVQAMDSGAIMAPRTLIALRPRAGIVALASSMEGFVARHVPARPLGPVKMRFYPLAERHLFPFNNAGGGIDLVRARTQLLTAIYGVAGIGVLIVLAAGINFVNASTARASRRAVEVGIRKATGAARRQLIGQFVGEALMSTILAMILAVGFAMLLRPPFEVLLGHPIMSGALYDSRLVLGMICLALLTGVLAGAYPAFVLASLRPAAVLKSGARGTTGSGSLRQGLVTVQFAILIGVSIVTAVVYRQTGFATDENLRFDKDQLLRIERACMPAIKAEVAALPGVRAVGCGPVGYNSRASTADGRPLGEWTHVVDDGFFRTLGLTPLAGRFFDPARGEDEAGTDPAVNPGLVINETAARKLGYSNPAGAVGQFISWQRMREWGGGVDTASPAPSRIIGVVADFAMNDSVMAEVVPRFYYIDPAVQTHLPLQVKLTGRAVPETLQAIDRIWDRLGDPAHPIQRAFFDQQIEALYHDLRQQEKVIGVFSAVTLIIAALGLFGLSAFVAEQRTREIGIRKALGAARGDVLRLMLWQFAKPVLWANVAAWPVAYAVTHHWLQGFASHVALTPGMFLAASVFALMIAMITVAGHTFFAVRTQPASALRYE